MRFKLLVFDLDGTAIESRGGARPTKRVLEAVKKAKGKMLVTIATGRWLPECKDVIAEFEIEIPVIVEGGTKIVEPGSWRVISESKLTSDQVKKIEKVLERYPYSVDETATPQTEQTILYLINVDPKKSDEIEAVINKIPGVFAVSASSWTPGKVDIHITSEAATKKEALRDLQKILGVTKAETVVIGDGENDLSLFESAGYKIAMGNGHPDLITKADWVAPSIDEDGLAKAIEKIIED